MDIAVVHGNYLESGGAEHVSRKLSKLFDAPLYYGFGKPESELSSEEIDCRSIYNDAPSAPIVKRSILLRDMYYMWNAQQIEELYEYDVLLFSKNELGWFVPKDDQVVIHYLHSTPRTPYDLFHEKGDSNVSRLYSLFARGLFLPNTKYPDKFIANSELVKRRAKKYWGIPEEKLEVVYPPTDTSRYGQQPTQDYYLTYSRMVPAKRMDDIIRAFDGLSERLVVGGTGKQEEELKEIAPDNVEFEGYLSEEEKIRRLGECKGLIFNAKNEDFGMVPVEGFASGVPVLGVDDGYTKHQIKDGKNGILHDSTPEGIRNAIQELEQSGVSWSRDEIQEFAERYSLDKFQTEIRDVVEETIEEVAISPE